MIEFCAIFFIIKPHIARGGYSILWTVLIGLGAVTSLVNCDIIYNSVAILGIKNINRMPQIQPQEITQFSLIDKTIQFTAK